MQQGSRGGAQLTIILSDTPVPRPAIGSYVGQGSERDLNPKHCNFRLSACGRHRCSCGLKTRSSIFRQDGQEASSVIQLAPREAQR